MNHPARFEQRLKAPQGMWRVVETPGHPEHSRLHAIRLLGDFKNYLDASDVVDKPRAASTRSLYNDKGIRCVSIEAGVGKS